MRTHGLAPGSRQGGDTEARMGLPSSSCDMEALHVHTAGRWSADSAASGSEGSLPPSTRAVSPDISQNRLRGESSEVRNAL